MQTSALPLILSCFLYSLTDIYSSSITLFLYLRYPINDFKIGPKFNSILNPTLPHGLTISSADPHHRHLHVGHCHEWGCSGRRLLLHDLAGPGSGVRRCSRCPLLPRYLGRQLHVYRRGRRNPTGSSLDVGLIRPRPPLWE